VTHVIENKVSRQDDEARLLKRVREWRSDLYRYGLRLTYDVALPDPGAELRRREAELQSIQDELSTDFQFNLVPSDIQPNNWKQLADQYGSN
jgi:hypothetical protein